MRKTRKERELSEIYGLDHSPWVQSVLLCLYFNKINYNIRTIPTVGLLIKSGVMMPALRIENSQWKLDSMNILQTLGCDPISSSESKLIFKTWRGVQHRADNPFKFFYSFSLCKGFYRNKFINLFYHACRPLISIYFLILLNIIKIKLKKFDTKENFIDQYVYWNNRLSNQDTNFFGGDTLNIIDYQLFGIIQSHCSIPYYPLIKTLQKNEELVYLRKWISNMHIKFAHYPHLYSADYFNPKQKNIQKSTFLERAAYWSGLMTMFVILPFTIILILYFFIKREP